MPLSSEPLAQHADRLSESWRSMAADAMSSWPSDLVFPAARGDLARGLANQMSASLALVRGAPGFFVPRIPIPWLQPTGSLEATSYYDSAPLKATLERLVDFDRINAGEKRFSVGAVNVGTGNFVYFDNTTHTIGPEHVMASGALPPSLPAIEIEGEYYWDGGLVSNTPLQWVLESEPRCDTLAFQVDLWSARGAFPRNMTEVTTRQKEIQYSSRTRANTDYIKRVECARGAVANLVQKLPAELLDSEDCRNDGVTDDEDHKIGRKIVGAVMKQFFAAYRTMIGNLQEAAEQFALPAVWTLHRKTPPHGFGGRNRLLRECHDKAP